MEQPAPCFTPGTRELVDPPVRDTGDARFNSSVPDHGICSFVTFGGWCNGNTSHSECEDLKVRVLPYQRYANPNETPEEKKVTAMETALLLNASYEPLKVIPLTKAITLVLAQKAVTEVESDVVFRSQHLTVRAPKVVRMLAMVKVPYRTRIPLTRTNLIGRDKGICGYCHKYVGAKGTIDHIVPRSRGGRHEWENVVLSCSPCNGKKDDKTLAELGWKALPKRTVPKGISWIIIGLHRPEPEWEPYLLVTA